MGDASRVEEAVRVAEEAGELDAQTNVVHHEAGAVSSGPDVLGASWHDGDVVLKCTAVKDNKNRAYLIFSEEGSAVDLKLVSKLGSTATLRMMRADGLPAMLGVAPAEMSPLALASISKGGVSGVEAVFASATLMKSQRMWVRALSACASLPISAEVLLNLVQMHTGKDIVLLDLDAAPPDVTSKSHASTPKTQKQKKVKKKDAQEAEQATGLGIDASKQGDFSRWYQQVVVRSEMIDYYDISGCYILRPWSYFMWEEVQRFFDTEIKKLGVQNCYFPVFVSERALTKEKDHVEGFAPEVAWVTRAGSSELKEPIAIRPTSETVMYPLFSKWIRSHRDLPLRLNQWSNVVRWEFTQATPFIRSREFLWQEGHTAFATREEADEEVFEILDLYRRVYEELLACPVIKGKKTEREKFAGGLFTTTVEAFVPAAGRGVQGATSHGLGQNFAKMFDIWFESRDGGHAQVWQNSWGLTTRTIGVMVMVHGDDRGLVLPPRVAPLQCILIPIPYSDDQKTELHQKCEELTALLRKIGVRVDSDLRTNYTPGYKFNHWEMRGVPLRLEIGPRDLAQRSVLAVRRDIGEKGQILWDDLEAEVPARLEAIQKGMLERARRESDERMVRAMTFEDFMKGLRNGCRILAPWCDVEACEVRVKERSGAESAEESQQQLRAQQNGDEPNEPGEFQALTGAAKSLCIPLDQPPMPKLTLCFQCGKPAKHWTIFGRSY